MTDALPPCPAPPSPAHPSPFGWLETPDGARLRQARWRPLVPARGAVALLGGRSEFIEKYGEQAQDWLVRRFQVFALDWRGQGLSTRPLPQGQRGHIVDFRLYEDDLARFLDSVAAAGTKGPLVLFAHSMGGLIVLNWLANRPISSGEPGPGMPNVAGVVLSAPMLAIHTAPLPYGLAGRIASLACRLGWAGRYAPGQDDYDPVTSAVFGGNVLTGDARRFQVHHAGFAANPALRLGGVTYGWLNAAWRAWTRLFAPGVAERIDVPTLVLSAPEDRVVDARAHRLLVRRLPRGTLKEYPGARHELMMEANPIRDRVWADIDAFLETIL